MANVNRTKSVTMTASSPPTEEQANVMEQAMVNVTHPGNPNTISPNFTAAKLTAPITNTLKTQMVSGPHTLT
jgi:hypothetical protein